MGLVVAFVAMGSLYVIERAAAWRRRVKFEQSRAKADYPITASDPTGNLIA